MKGFKQDYNTFEIGGYKISLKNFKKVIGHDDSLPYVANVYVNGERVCTCYNDGWGGETNITQVMNETLLNEVNKFVKGLPYPKFEWDEDNPMFDTLKMDSIVTIADAIAYNMDCIKRAIKKAGLKTSIIALKGDTIKTLKLNNNIGYEDMINNANPKTTIFKRFIAHCEIKCEQLIRDGFIIVNTPQMHFK